METSSRFSFGNPPDLSVRSSQFANDEIRDSSDVIVRYPETSSDSDDSDRREIVLPIDSSIIDDYGDFDALEKLAELMQEKGLTQDDLLVVLNAVKLKNIEK